MQSIATHLILFFNLNIGLQCLRYLILTLEIFIELDHVHRYDNYLHSLFFLTPFFRICKILLWTHQCPVGSCSRALFSLLSLKSIYFRATFGKWRNLWIVPKTSTCSSALFLFHRALPRWHSIKGFTFKLIWLGSLMSMSSLLSWTTLSTWCFLFWFRMQHLKCLMFYEYWNYFNENSD